MKPFESVCVRAEVELSRSRGSAEEEALLKTQGKGSLMETTC